MKHAFLVFWIILFTTVSCAPQPRLIEHKKPELSQIDTTYFEDLGCFEEAGCSTSLPQDMGFSIMDILEPSEFLGGLDPAVPIAETETFDFQHDPTIPSVYSARCAATFYINYLVYLHGEVQVVDSKQDLAQLFAPIESPEEALSFAVAATGYKPMYDLESIAGLEIVSKKLEETYVRKIRNGYVVHLFDYFLCHCGPFIIRSVDVTVTKDGEVSISDEVDAYHDPRFDQVCID